MVWFTGPVVFFFPFFVRKHTIVQIYHVFPNLILVLWETEIYFYHVSHESHDFFKQWHSASEFCLWRVLSTLLYSESWVVSETLVTSISVLNVKYCMWIQVDKVTSIEISTFRATLTKTKHLCHKSSFFAILLKGLFNKEFLSDLSS